MSCSSSSRSLSSAHASSGSACMLNGRSSPVPPTRQKQILANIPESGPVMLTPGGTVL
jgi:hypothetical protein